MIKSITTKDGLLHKILGEKIIDFTDGMNIIWGKNGTGKSLLLRTMANYCFVENTAGGGWSQKDIFFRFSSYDYKYNMQDKNLSNIHKFDKNSKIDIDWSGKAAFYMHHDQIIDDIHTLGYEMNGSEWIHGLGKIRDVYKKHSFHPSTGQLIKGVIEMLLKIEAPDFSKLKEGEYRDDINEYVKLRKETFQGNDKPTLLLDEVDSQLDLFNQMWFHKEVVPKLLEKYQIIMASHSIFAAFYYPTIIQLDDSLDMVKNELKNI
jgi:predicted ATPase